MATLPTPRQLLTSLLTTLTTGPSHQPTTNPINEPYSGPTNPLKNLPQQERALLTTLHVLFPPPMLLQALDLLDRGLVLRLVEKNPLSLQDPSMCAEEERKEKQVVYSPQANIHLPLSPFLPGPSNKDGSGSCEKAGNGARRNTVYQVRSSQPPKSRFRDSGVAATGTVYTVRLEAWNCSCAAFAFSAFPGGLSLSSISSALWNLSEEEDEMMCVGRRREIDDEGGGRGWELGGLSSDGRSGKGGEGGAVPVCKHLIACLLGERWEVLREYVREREVGREEMVGVGGEG